MGSASVDTDASHGETMLDLYTGIGYFSMPALVHTNVAHVHMAEWNPHAVEAIRRNVVANRIVPQRYSIYAGDNRELRHVSHETIIATNHSEYVDHVFIFFNHTTK